MDEIAVTSILLKPDVVGALFGQTEGIFGSDLDLRELYKTGRIGRIEIKLESKQDRTEGTIGIPSSLDKASTSILAAAVESVDRIGPCSAKVKLEKIEDVRRAKRETIIKRAKEILQDWTMEATPDTGEVVHEVSDTLKAVEVEDYGPEKLPAGPEVDESNSVILVEGRADVINLLRCGFKNVIATNGAKIPKTAIDLSKRKEVTAFLDGDRGGTLILKELAQVADVKYIARAPRGREVEELTPKEVYKALKEKVPFRRDLERKRPPRREVAAKPVLKVQLPAELLGTVRSLKGTLEAVLLDANSKSITKMPVSQLAERLPEMEGVDTVVFDGVITQRLVDIAESRGVKLVIGDRVSDVAKRPVSMKLLTFEQIDEGIQKQGG